MRASEDHAGTLGAERASAALGGRRPLPEDAQGTDRDLIKLGFGSRLDVFFLRSDAGAAGAGAPALGEDLVGRLRHELAASRAVWKVIVSCLPLGLGVWAALRGRSAEPSARGVADLLDFIAEAGISNTIWLSVERGGAGEAVESLAADLMPLWHALIRPEGSGIFAPEPPSSGGGICYHALADVHETTRDVSVLATGRRGAVVWQAELAAA